MWTSSTATPAATGAGPSGGAERNASSGRSRLPPEASASEPTLATRPEYAETAAASRASTCSM